MTNVNAKIVRTESLFIKSVDAGQRISDLQNKVDSLTDLVNWLADNLEKMGTEVPKDLVK